MAAAAERNFATDVNTLGRELSRPERMKELENALKAHPALSPERMVSVVLAYVQQNPTVFECTLTSVCKAMIDAAMMGLEPNGLLAMGYLVPFSVKVPRSRDEWVKEAKFIAGYRGLIDLALRGQAVRLLETEVVFVKDHFSYRRGLQTVLEHVPYGFKAGEQDDPGDLIATYAIATLANGQQLVEAVPKRIVERTRDSSNAVRTARSNAEKYNTAPRGPWFETPEPMWRKTALHQIFKYLPLTPGLVRALSVEAEAEAGVSTIEGSFEPAGPGSQAPASGVESLKKALGPATTNPLKAVVEQAPKETVPVNRSAAASPPPQSQAAPDPGEQTPQERLDAVLWSYYQSHDSTLPAYCADVNAEVVFKMTDAQATELANRVRADLGASR